MLGGWGERRNNELFINKSLRPKAVRTNSTRRELEMHMLKCFQWGWGKKSGTRKIITHFSYLLESLRSKVVKHGPKQHSV